MLVTTFLNIGALAAEGRWSGECSQKKSAPWSVVRHVRHPPFGLARRGLPGRAKGGPDYRNREARIGRKRAASTERVVGRAGKIRPTTRSARALQRARLCATVPAAKNARSRELRMVIESTPTAVYGVLAEMPNFIGGVPASCAPQSGALPR
jgi:hypothetical protein